MHLVQYVAVAPHLLRSAPALFVVQSALTKCVVDRTQLDRRMIGILNVLSATLTSAITRRNVPAADSWGYMRLPLVEASAPGLLIPKITPHGIEIPLPCHLITEDLAQHLAALGGNGLRFYHPPTL